MCRSVRARKRPRPSCDLFRAQADPRLDIPKAQAPLISRVAPLSRSARAQKDAALAAQKQKWGTRKQIFRELREKRRTFW